MRAPVHHPSGRFIIGGPQSDADPTSGEIFSDTYGGWGAHGGGALYDKDPTEVYRAAACACRQLAKAEVKSGLGMRALVQLSYASGVANFCRSSRRPAGPALHVCTASKQQGRKQQSLCARPSGRACSHARAESNAPHCIERTCSSVLY